MRDDEGDQGEEKGHEPICTGAGQHLVDAENVEGVDTDPQVEGILAGGLRDVLVCANTSGLEGLAGELFILIGDKVAAERELVDGGTLAAEVEDTDLEGGQS